MICSPTKSGDFEHLHFYNIQYTNTKKPPRCAKSPDFEQKQKNKIIRCFLRQHDKIRHQIKFNNDSRCAKCSATTLRKVSRL